MCRKRLAPKPCMNYECPHNLFWKGLRLNPEKFKITNRSLEIGNCCCLINEPWTAEEIGEYKSIKKSQQENERLKREIEELNKTIKKSKQVDIEIDEKKKEISK